MKVLLDASALVPLVVERDQWHRNITRILATMRREPPTLLTTNWTLYEALAITSRYGHERARALFGLASQQMTISPVAPDVEVEALRRFLSWRDKTASVVDHANTLIAVERSCEAVVSFDLDFVPLAQAAGLTLLR